MFNLDQGVTDGWVDALNLIDSEMPYRKEDFYNAIKPEAQGQQTWWYNEAKALGIIPTNVNVYACGYGIYSVPLLRRLGAHTIRMYDYDKEVETINWRVNKYDCQFIKYEHHVMDVVFDHDWINKNADVVLNTSCEVMYHFNKLIKSYSDTTFILQGTNRPKRGNINIHHSLDDFIASTGVTNVLYKGVMEEGQHERYMVIGK